jgi:hypothetical protein
VLKNKEKRDVSKLYLSKEKKEFLLDEKWLLL